MSVKTIFVVGVFAILLFVFLFVPLSAYSFCRTEDRIKDKAHALSLAIDLTRKNNWANFQEIGGTQGFLTLLQTEPNCCEAGGADFNWDYMTWVWWAGLTVRSQAPGYSISFVIDHCGKPLWHGVMVEGSRPQQNYRTGKSK